MVSSFNILRVNHWDSSYTGSGVIKCFECFFGYSFYLHNSTPEGLMGVSVNPHHMLSFCELIVIQFLVTLLGFATFDPGW